jgi:hypothetical protein
VCEVRRAYKPISVPSSGLVRDHRARHFPIKAAARGSETSYGKQPAKPKKVSHLNIVYIGNWQLSTARLQSILTVVTSSQQAGDIFTCAWKFDKEEF